MPLFQRLIMREKFVIPKTENRDLCKNLSHSEFKCKCANEDCTFTLVDPKLLVAFQKLRGDWGSPISISSGYRCQKHNASQAVNGSNGSKHKLGSALDMTPKHGDLEQFHEYVKKYFKWTKIYKEQNFVHGDVRE